MLMTNEQPDTYAYAKYKELNRWQLSRSFGRIFRNRGDPVSAVAQLVRGHFSLQEQPDNARRGFNLRIILNNFMFYDLIALLCALMRASQIWSNYATYVR